MRDDDELGDSIYARGHHISERAAEYRKAESNAHNLAADRVRRALKALEAAVTTRDNLLLLGESERALCVQDQLSDMYKRACEAGTALDAAVLYFRRKLAESAPEGGEPAAMFREALAQTQQAQSDFKERFPALAARYRAPSTQLLLLRQHQEASDPHTLAADWTEHTTVLNTQPRVLSTSNAHGAGKIWSKLLWTIGPVDGGDRVGFSPDGRVLGLAKPNGTVQLLEAESGSEIRTLRQRGWKLAHFAFLNERCLATLYQRTNPSQPASLVSIWDASSGAEVKRLSIASVMCYSIAFSQDGRRVAAAGIDEDYKGVLQFWNVATGLSGRRGRRRPYGLRCVALQQQGEWVATGSAKGKVDLWTVPGARRVRTMKVGSTGSCLNRVVFSPDGRLIAAAGVASGAVELWEVASGRVVHTLRNGGRRTTDVSFSPDGSVLIVSSADHAVRMWEVETGNLIRTFAKHTAAVQNVALTLDGRLFATAARDLTVRVWRLGGSRTLAGRAAQDMRE
jgi:WD40 repeat protein